MHLRNTAVDLCLDHDQCWGGCITELGLYRIPESLEGIEDPVIVAPDMGGMKRAKAYGEAMGAQVAIIDKRRLSGDKVDWEHMIGEVRGKDALLVDDMITTGGSMVQAVRIAKDQGARSVKVAATHGVFCGNAVENLNNSGADAIVVTDTVCLPDPLPERFQCRSVAPTLARAIAAIHNSDSVSQLFES